MKMPEPHPREEEATAYAFGLMDAAERIASLSPAQVMKIASSNTLICRMRIDDDLVGGGRRDL